MIKKIKLNQKLQSLSFVANGQPYSSKVNFKIFKNREGDLFKKLPKPNIWLLVNHTKPTNTLY